VGEPKRPYSLFLFIIIFIFLKPTALPLLAK
jgi:hypothetical protein